MKVQKSTASAAPGYPSRRHLAQFGAVLSLSAIGLTGCRTAGKMACEPAAPIESPPIQEETFVTGGVMAAEPVKEAVATTHVVAPGETLYGLARRYLGRGERWPEIAAANPAVSAKRLRPGTTLHLPAR